MEETILFVEIFQPFAQYRNPFTFYYAQTYPLPPKSTIIGMLQNACNDWYGNNQEKGWDSLKVSIHGGFESIFWNYQNLIKGETKFNENMQLVNQRLPLYAEGLTSQRSPVSQQELFNGHLFIFLKNESDFIKRLADVLERPNKILYLGRSEDIAFIRKVKEVESKEISVEGDIKLTYPTYILLEGFPLKNKKYPVYSIPLSVNFKNNGQRVRHKAEITKNTVREAEFRTVIYTGYDYSVILDENSGPIKVDEIMMIEDKTIRIYNPYGWL